MSVKPVFERTETHSARWDMVLPTVVTAPPTESTPPETATKPTPVAKSLAILLADNDLPLLTQIAEQLRLAGHNVTECRDGDQLADVLDTYVDMWSPRGVERRFDMIITGFRMPGVLGLGVPTILLADRPDEETIDVAKRHGVSAVFCKPVAIDDLLQAVSQLS